MDPVLAMPPSAKVVLDGSASSDSRHFWHSAGRSTWLTSVSALCQRYWHQGTTSDLHKLFADDCLLYRTINSVADEEQLQQDLNTMVEWSNTWLMRFSAAKCHLLKMTRQKKTLPTKYTINSIQLQ